MSREPTPKPGTRQLLEHRRVAEVIDAICEARRVSLKEVMSHGRGKTGSVLDALGECAHTLKGLGFSWREVGDMLGRDAPAVLRSANRYAKRNSL